MAPPILCKKKADENTLNLVKLNHNTSKKVFRCFEVSKNKTKIPNYILTLVNCSTVSGYTFLSRIFSKSVLNSFIPSLILLQGCECQQSGVCADPPGFRHGAVMMYSVAGL